MRMIEYKSTKILLFSLVVGLLLLLCGCVLEQDQIKPFTEQAQTVTDNLPTNINFFASVKEGNMIRFFFLLEDKLGRNVPADGHVKLKIFDDFNNLLYYEEFDVKSSEFVDYQFRITGQVFGKAYEWRVPISKIKKGFPSLGFGKAILTFETLDKKRLHAETMLRYQLTQKKNSYK